MLAALGARIEVIQSKVEDLDLGANSVDVLISEPMGTLLVNERMLETYLHARDRFLKPGGRMFPVKRSPDTRSNIQPFCLLHATVTILMSRHAKSCFVFPPCGAANWADTRCRFHRRCAPR